jgi:hypothetical protein
MTKAKPENKAEDTTETNVANENVQELLNESTKNIHEPDIDPELIDADIDTFDDLAKKTKTYGIISEKEKHEANKKMDYLIKQIDESLKDYERRKRRNRRPALMFKILIAGLSSVVTILLGVRVGDGWVKYLDQTALIISALMSVVTTWNAFYDYTALWVQFTKTVAQLGLLKKDIEYLRMGNEEITVSEVNYLKERFDDILHEAVKLVVRVRSEDVRETKK